MVIERAPNRTIRKSRHPLIFFA